MWPDGPWAGDSGEIIPVKGLGKNLLMVTEGDVGEAFPALRKPTVRDGQAAFSRLGYELLT